MYIVVRLARLAPDPWTAICFHDLLPLPLLVVAMPCLERFRVPRPHLLRLGVRLRLRYRAPPLHLAQGRGRREWEWGWAGQLRDAGGVEGLCGGALAWSNPCLTHLPDPLVAHLAAKDVGGAVDLLGMALLELILVVINDSVSAAHVLQRQRQACAVEGALPQAHRVARAR